MGYIPKPSNIAVGNSISASDIAFIYDSMSSGTADINVYSIEADHLSLAESDAGASFWGSIINLNNSNQLATFTKNPIDFKNNHINAVMKEYGLTASEELEGTLANVGWIWRTKQSSLLTCCMWDGKQYKWIYKRNFYSEWLIKLWNE